MAAITLVLLAIGSWIPAVAVAGGVFVIVGIANFAIDPYQKFRRPTRYRTYYSRPRHLNPGLARHHDYDTALVGSSMIGSFQPGMVEKEMGGKCVKIPMYGASGLELAMTLRPVIEAAKRTRARLVFLQTTCGADEQHQRLEGRQRHDTRSDGRVELMDQQRGDFEPPNAGAECFFHTIDTSGPKAETQAKVEALLTKESVL